MENLRNKDPFLQDKNIALALSGGIDSVVLLHFLQTHYPNNLRAIHCNHHLSKQCEQWEKFCKNLCERLNITYFNVDIFIENKSNIEENARKKRYQALSDCLKKGEILCTAHHQNDQAETLLLQLFRGSGVRGLSAMPRLKPLGKGRHYRPLLGIGVAVIVDYAKEHKLRWIEDDSNKNMHFKRNFIRLSVIPQLSKAYQNLTKTLSRSARHQTESLKLAAELAALDIKHHNMINKSGRLSVKALIKLEPHRIKNILRQHLYLMHFLMPTDKVMHQMMCLLHAKIDAKPLVAWHHYELRRYRDELYFIDTHHPKTKQCPFYAALKDLPDFSIRYRTEGQRIQLAGKAHSQSVKKVMQAAQIPPWERSTLRMYYIGNQLYAIERIGKMA